jgi:hypothetical protein
MGDQLGSEGTWLPDLKKNIRGSAHWPAEIPKIQTRFVNPGAALATEAN